MSSPTSRLLYHNYELPLSIVASSLLHRSTSSHNTLLKARQLHALILISTPPSISPFLYNNLLSLYFKCGSLADARKLFDKMPTRNLISYNAMIAAYSRDFHHAAYALRIFCHMGHVGLRPNASTFSSLVRASTSLRDARIGAAVQTQVVRLGFLNSICVKTALVGMYAECGSVDAANLVFSEMGERDVISWNTIIHCSVRNGSVARGLEQFGQMIMEGLVPTQSTFSIVLSGCGRMDDLNKGRIIHSWIVKSELEPDVPLQNALLDMYSSCGDLGTALCVFERIEMPDLVSWNSVIAGYSGIGCGEKAMNAFIQLRNINQSGGLDPDEYTFAAVVSATATLPAMYYGKPLHSLVIRVGIESNIYVGNTLINMYFMNGEPDSSRMVFNFLPEKDAIIWTEMVVGHSTLGEGELAMSYFHTMQEEGHQVDSFSLSGALNSSADLAVLKQGEMLHGQVVKAGYEENMCVSGSLIDMYAKNGYLEGAHSVFSRIEKPDLKCWNSMIGGYGNHGNTEEAFKLFSEMVSQGLQPDRVTYVSLLSACSHCGLVERGRFYWFCILTDGIMPGFKHYTCMVSLLSRAGLLQEAEELIIRSSFANNSPELWRILLSSCVTFKDAPLGVHAAEQILKLDPEDSSTYILLSNLYASVGRWDCVAEMRKRIRGLMVEKEPGLSWIEIKNSVHIFSANDEYHIHIEDCRNELLRLQGNLKLSKTTEPELLCGL
ncbi:pentatricopeptide repeat-containing protein At3g50420 [Typha latifolia]|uniref:pentatricopeptide repeat-containing protein At3g50420 n=1 Tax=Typha latifolia TaxID=4733 RepID=UPI003C2C13D1